MFGVRQGSYLLLLLLVAVMDPQRVISTDPRWNLLCADDILLAAPASMESEEDVRKWKVRLQKYGLSRMSRRPNTWN